MGFSQYVGEPLELAFVTSALNANLEQSFVAIPEGVAAGDLCVFLDHARSYSSLSTPSGFQLVASTETGSSHSLRSSYKVLTAGDISGGSIAGTSASINVKIALFFRPNLAIGSVQASTPNTQATSGTPSSQVVEASEVDGPAIVIASITDDSVITSADVSSTPAFDGKAGGNRHRAGYAVENTEPQDHTITGTAASGNKIMHSFYLKVS